MFYVNSRTLGSAKLSSISRFKDFVYYFIWKDLKQTVKHSLFSPHVYKYS